MMRRPTLRIVLPVAVVRGIARLTQDHPYDPLVKALVDVVGPQATFAKISSKLPFPASMTARLVTRAIQSGVLQLSHDLLVPRADGPTLHFAGLTDDTIEEEFECAIDLSCKLLHDPEWVSKNTCSLNEDDSLIEATVTEDQVPQLLREMHLGDVLRHSRKPNAGTGIGASQLFKEVEGCDGLEIRQVTTSYVAIDLQQYFNGDLSRWLVKHHTPPTIIECMRQRKPELLSVILKSPELRDQWQPTSELELLDQAEALWEKVQWAGFPRTPEVERNDMAQTAIEKTESWERHWSETSSKSDVESIDVCFGPGRAQSDQLGLLCQQTRKMLVILTSFINERYAESFSKPLNRLPLNCQVLILYGHANDEDVNQQSAALGSYINHLRKFLRPDLRIAYSPLVRRSHEKIIVSDDSSFMLGSWNACSSSPSSDHVETSLVCKSQEKARELCQILTEESDHDSAKLLSRLTEELSPTRANVPTSLSLRLDSVYSLIKYTSTRPTVRERILYWRKWRRQLRGLKDILWTFFDSPRITVVRGDVLRDVLVEQVGTAKHSLLISTDRVNPTGLDSSLAKLLLSNKKRVRIVWGIEDPDWNLDEEPEAAEEVNLAIATLREFSKNNPNALTLLEPMRNHSKIVIIDENRFLISSSNFLAKGNEPNEESSSEIGILVESPLIARRLLGRFMLRYPKIDGWIDISKMSGQPWDLYEMALQEVESMNADPQMETPVTPKTLEFAVGSRFKKFTTDGKILDDDHNVPLSHRWNELMYELGNATPENLSGVYWEDYLNWAHEMLGLQKCYSKDNDTYSVRLRQPVSPIAPWSTSHGFEAASMLKDIRPKPRPGEEANTLLTKKYLDNFRVLRNRENN